MKKILKLVLTSFLFFSLCGCDEEEGYVNESFELGSATSLEGNVILVSIYADDTESSWQGNNDKLREDIMNDYVLSTKYLEKAAKQYGSDVHFIYDYEKNEDLYYETEFEVDLKDEDSCYDAWEFIDENIDTDELLSKYEADNIIYMFLINSPNSNDMTSCTTNWTDDNEYPYEMCFMFMHTDNEQETPAAFAHEILHTFGAPDLYLVDEDGSNYGISEDYVEALEVSDSNDIMFTTYDAKTYKPHYDKITNEFSEIDAYYVGLTDYSEVVADWGFEESQHAY